MYDSSGGSLACTEVGFLECSDFVTRNVFALTPRIGLELQAEMEALSDLKDQKVDLATNIATANQTALMVSDVINRLVAARRAFKRGRFREVANLLRVRYPPRRLTSDWLAYQYGVKPFLSDVHGAMESLYKTLNRDPLDWAITGKGRASGALYLEEQFLGGPGQPDSARVVHRGTESCFVRVDAGPTQALLSAAASLGLTNPATVAWELIPFSFVVDWFLPIGDYFSTLDSTYGLQFLGGSLSSRVQYTSEINRGIPGSDTWGASNARYSAFHSGWAKRMYLNRSVYSEFPAARPLYWKSPFSFTRLANSLSLLAQVRA